MKKALRNQEKQTPWSNRNVNKDAHHAKLRQQIVEITTREKPDGATHWSTRTLAAKLGTNHNFVSRVWREHGEHGHSI